MTKLTGPDKGGLLAAANALTIAAWAGVLSTNGYAIESTGSWLPSYGSGLVVLGLLLLPAVLAGAALGKLAASLHASRRVRFRVLAAGGVACVALLGAVAMWLPLVPGACVSTVAWTLCLERWTRPARWYGAPRIV